ncbi:hypothetical protein [Aurantimicrobium minutum]|uniref:Uncharacterized protein n=1 Tax=Aurantimicrobium minutum TaxID=708131 RepID=A0A173LXV2_9MICO|nr:hypothetical protein [Aurantimicrobium minutum]BAU99684.1 Uncharacterized protein AUMI_111420 [Aurantimicrobium minutum]
MSETSFLVRCQILGELWEEYKFDVEFEDFISFNDLGLTLAYAFANGIIVESEKMRQLIDQTFDTYLNVCGLEKDIGFDNLADLFRETNQEIDK